MRKVRRSTRPVSTARKRGAVGSRTRKDTSKDVDGGVWRPHFNVSAGLKRIIGSDLVTDDLIAIFELVKNSYDAHATHVEISFDGSAIHVCDNGKGMAPADIRSKWLFVAYSAKRDGTEDLGYRDRIAARRHYAGNKGIGRFSCDRLGAELTMQTKTSDSSLVQVIDIEWNQFDDNDKTRFESIPLKHSEQGAFTLPAKVPKRGHGTILTIRSLRDTWPRTKILRLKAALSKLVNPLHSKGDEFGIQIIAQSELAADAAVRDKSPEEANRLTVNGKINNFVFETLRSKTTRLETKISDGQIYSSLIDRGTLIYRTTEHCPFGALENSDFDCTLYYLNRSAKHTFTLRVGIPPVQFGSIFLFRHGFRVYPYGEPGDDTFEIDRRKQQGYARFLGTRDVIGRIDIGGPALLFQETSSRDKGLVENKAYLELLDCFREYCLKRLERYVVGVSWEDPADADTGDTSRLTSDSASARIANVVARLTESDSLQILEYNKDLIRVVSERASEFERSTEALSRLALRLKDPRLQRQVEEARQRYEKLVSAADEARRAAEKERALREKAEKEARRAQTSLVEERKRNLFLSSLAGLDTDTILNLHHQIVIYATDIQHLVSNRLEELAGGDSVTKKDLLFTFENVAFKVQKILAASRFATKANFRLDAEEIRADLAEYIREYIEKVCPLGAGDGVRLAISGEASLSTHFRPIDVSILVDNLVSNAKKAKARTVSFAFEQLAKDHISLTVTDDGRGLHADIDEPDRIFEKGITTTSGSGLGLYFARQIVEQMGGKIGVTIQKNRRLQIGMTFTRAGKSTSQ